MIAAVFQTGQKFFHIGRATWPLLLVLEIVASLNAHAFGKQTAVRHIAVIAIGSPTTLLPQIRGFNAGLEEAGYVEGKQIIFHVIHVESEPQLYTALKDTLRGHRIDAIVAPSTIEALVASKITATIPIVFIPARDPVRVGLVASLARTGTNLTGLSYSRDVEDSSKQLAVFKEIVPSMRRVVLLYQREQTDPAIIDTVNHAGAKLQVEISWRPVRSLAEAEKVTANTSKQTTDAISLICSAIFRGLKVLVDTALSKGLPVFGCAANQVADDGALMTYAPDIYYLGYRGAWYIDRILKGAKPQELPVEVPSKFELIINLKTAKALGLKIPPGKLILADKVFQ